MPEHAEGGERIETLVKKEEKSAPLASGWGDSVFIELVLTATAIGTPSIQMEPSLY